MTITIYLRNSLFQRSNYIDLLGASLSSFCAKTHTRAHTTTVFRFSNLNIGILCLLIIYWLIQFVIESNYAALLISPYKRQNAQIVKNELLNIKNFEWNVDFIMQFIYAFNSFFFLLSPSFCFCRSSDPSQLIETQSLDSKLL